MRNRFAAVAICFFALILTGQAGVKVRNDYKLTVAVVELALKEQQLFQAEEFVSTYNGGSYTNPNPETQVHDYWSDGRYSMLDRDDNGHHETIFLLKDDQLVYVGSIGLTGTKWMFVDVANECKSCYGKPLGCFTNTLPVKAAIRKDPVDGKASGK